MRKRKKPVKKAKRAVSRKASHSEVFYRELVETSQGLMCMHDLQGRLISVNRSAAEALGYLPEEMVGRNMAEFIAPEVVGRVKIYFNKLRQNTSAEGTLQLLTRDHQPRYWLFRSRLLPAAKKEQSVMGYAVDITARVEVERRLREAEDRYRDLFENAYDLIQSVTPEGRFLYVNRAWKKTLGYSDQEVPGLSILAIIHPDSLAHCQDMFRRVLQGEDVGPIEAAFRTKDGRKIELEGSVSCRFENGRPVATRAIFRDITARKQQDAVLAETNRLFHALMDSIPDSIYFKDEESRFTRINRAQAKVLGLDDPAKAIGMSDTDFFVSEHAKVARQEELRIMQTGEAMAGKLEKVTHQDGTFNWFSATKMPLRDSGGAVHGTFGVSRNVTELVEAEQSLSRSERRLQHLMDNVPAGIYQADLAGRCMFCNQRLLEMAGLPLSKMLGEGWMSALHPEDREAVEGGWNVSAGKGREFTLEYRMITPRGFVTWVVDRAVPIRDDAGNVYGYFGTVSDISERKQNEEILERLQRRHQLILDSAGDGLWVSDLDGNSTFVNQATCRMLGYEARELLGRNMHRTTHHTRPDGSNYPATECPVYLTSRDGVSRYVPSELFWRKDGTSFPVEYRTAALVEKGEIIGAVNSFHDISERLALERMKDEFISTVSHELRTPLTSIRGALGLLAAGKAGEMPERAQRMLDIAVSNTDRLVRMINDILDIERMESGRVALQRRECEVGPLMEHACEVMRPMAEKAGVELRVVPELVTLFADPDRIIQTFTNLLSNAIKFSPPGGTVVLAVENTGKEAQFTISDQGRGIPPEKLELVFLRFQQVDASDAREKGGSGLGLAICKSIVQQHGGRIWVESEVGKGSKFHVTLPLAQERRKRARAGARTPSEEGRLTILVCDEHPPTRERIGGLLRDAGYQTLLLPPGENVVRAAAKERPDAVLMDAVSHSVSTGHIAAALHADPETRDIPVLLFNLAQPDGDAANDEDLLASLKEALGDAARPHVLLVEDDLDLAQLLKEMLESRGLTVWHADTGKAALEFLEKGSPGLLILDLILPDVDGFAIADWLREHHSQPPPIFVYTNLELEPDDLERLQLGKTHFFTKSRVRLEHFEARVLSLLRRLIEKETREAKHAD